MSFRHSAAKSAVVTVRQDDSSLFLSVEDDGSGFDPDTTRGLGMLGMEERVRQLGGHLEIRSKPGKGTGAPSHAADPRGGRPY